MESGGKKRCLSKSLASSDQKDFSNLCRVTCTTKSGVIGLSEAYPMLCLYANLDGVLLVPYASVSLISAL